MGTAIKHRVAGRVKPLFVIFDIRALWRLNPVWHRMLYCCTHMWTVGDGRQRCKPDGVRTTFLGEWWSCDASYRSWDQSIEQ